MNAIYVSLQLFVVPSDPIQMLSDGDINPGMALIMGAQTNDSNKELFPAFLKKDGSLRALPTDAYLESLNLLVPKNNEHLFRDVLKMYPSHNDNPKDPVLGGSVSNLRNLGSATTDIMLCGARRRLSMINKRYPGKAFMYRFNYWYQSNKNCTAEPNYHSAQFGSQHEDEVTFVMGQPNFMQGGSCCGVFGDHTNSTAHPNISACPLDPQCAACYAPEKFDPHHEGGYTPYFNSTEAAFAEAVGQFWTNFASSQNPNVRAKAGEGGQEGAGDDGVWPVTRPGRPCTRILCSTPPSARRTTPPPRTPSTASLRSARCGIKSTLRTHRRGQCLNPGQCTKKVQTASWRQMRPWTCGAETY